MVVRPAELGTFDWPLFLAVLTTCGLSLLTISSATFQNPDLDGLAARQAFWVCAGLLALLVMPEWRWWGGVPTPDYSLDPNPVSLLIFFYIFAFGWMIQPSMAVSPWPISHAPPFVLTLAWMSLMSIATCRRRRRHP